MVSRRGGLIKQGPLYTKMCEVGGNTVAKCRDCETPVSAKSDRLRNHRIKYGAVTNTDENPTTPTDSLTDNYKFVN